MTDPASTLDNIDSIPADEWALYLEAIEAVQRAGVPFAVGGGIAQSYYAQRSRYTKDVDLFLQKEHRQPAIDAIRRTGFADYFDQSPYERHWIFRGERNGLILDLIWQMANARAEVDADWVSVGPVVSLHGAPLRLVPPEEMIWGKMYVLQRDRSDWPDIFNTLECIGHELDWARLVTRVGEDLPVLASAVQVFGWVDPMKARTLPADVWSSLGITPPAPVTTTRERFLDSRDWFGQTCNGDSA